MTMSLLVVIAFAALYAAYLLDQIRGELQAIRNDIPRVDLHALEYSLDTIERIMLAEETKRDRAELEARFTEDEGENEKS
jgi:hypothetical protein